MGGPFFGGPLLKEFQYVRGVLGGDPFFSFFFLGGGGEIPIWAFFNVFPDTVGVEEETLNPKPQTLNPKP